MQKNSGSRWFHKVDGPTAEFMLLNQGSDGSFLARPSASKPGDYTLSVRRGSQVTHVKIQSNGDFFDLYGGDKFATLQELVEHYMSRLGTIKETNGQVIELKHPLINESNLTLPDETAAHTPWFHKHISGVTAEQMLKDKGKPGSFLVRESSNQQNTLVLCVLVDQQVLHIRIFHSHERGYDVGGGQSFKMLTELIDFYKRTPMVDKSGTVVQLKVPFNVTRTTAARIDERIRELEQNAGFWHEFEELQREETQEEETRHIQERKVGSEPQNKSKNRFKNILPFDNTRVVLNQDLPDVEPNEAADGPSDYINANYIKSETRFTGCRDYIATQGPMTNTIGDFWRMIWQEESRIIVMATKVEERSKTKCALYWPELYGTKRVDVHNGYFELRNLGVEKSKEYEFEVSLIEVRREPDGDEPREIFHFQYFGWPDHNVPQDPSSVVRLLCRVNERASELKKIGPVVVHCSAGIGRTGSVIVIDMLLCYIRAHGVNHDIDIQKLTQYVRRQRSGMVQTESQYQFVYRAVSYFVNEPSHPPDVPPRSSRLGCD